MSKYLFNTTVTDTVYDTELIFGTNDLKAMESFIKKHTTRKLPEYAKITEVWNDLDDKTANRYADHGTRCLIDLDRLIVTIDLDGTNSELVRLKESLVYWLNIACCGDRDWALPHVRYYTNLSNELITEVNLKRKNN